MSKDYNYNKLICSSRWVKLRKKKITKDPLCEMCKEKGIIKAVEEVHHIVPVESVKGMNEMRSLMFDINNLMSLCSRCHQTIHKELSSKTKEGLRKRNDVRNDHFKKKYLG